MYIVSYIIIESKYLIMVSDAQEDTIREIFLECGSIQNVRLVREKCSGMGKGIGFVIFNVSNLTIFYSM